MPSFPLWKSQQSVVFTELWAHLQQKAVLKWEIMIRWEIIAHHSFLIYTKQKEVEQRGMFASTAQNASFPGQCSSILACSFQAKSQLYLKINITFWLKTFRFSDWHLHEWSDGKAPRGRDAEGSESYMCWTSLEIKLLVPIYPTKSCTHAWHMGSLVDVSEAASMHTMKYINLCRIETISLWITRLVLNLKPVSLENTVSASCKR